MSLIHSLWGSTGSTLTPMTLALRLSNSGLSLATAPSSVVHTGVKSLGWENRTPHLSPSPSGEGPGRSVVSAVKAGAASPSCSGIAPPLMCVLGRGHAPGDRVDCRAD